MKKTVCSLLIGIFTIGMIGGTIGLGARDFQIFANSQEPNNQDFQIFAGNEEVNKNDFQIFA